MSWKFTSDQPVYIQIEHHIKSDIINGVYKVDEQIPSVRQLALEAGVNPNTVQRALSEPDAQGILVSETTSGRFVTSDEAVLAKLRTDEAETLVKKMILGARALGLTKEETIKKMQESEEWDK